MRLRQAIGPTSLDEALSSLDLEESLLEFVTNIREVCEAGAEVKRLSLLEALAEHRKEMLMKQTEHHLTPLNNKDSIQYNAVMV